MKLLGIKYLVVSTIITSTLLSCDTEIENLEIQKLYTYDDQYYENLRTYKKSDHQLFYGFYAAYAPVEGTTGNKEPASWGERIIGIPDSADIINLWMGIPTEDWQPLALEDMRFCQKMKGTRFVSHEDASNKTSFEDKNGQTIEIVDEESVKLYGQYMVDRVLDNDLDGVDIDYEPSQGVWNTSDQYLHILVEYIAQFFGPQGKYPDKLLIVDFYTHYPPSSIEPYVDYFVRQAYTQGFTEHSAARLETYRRDWLPDEKFIVCETFGVWYENGGSPFTEADGNQYTTDGSRMYSLEGFARWIPNGAQTKGGYGAFYFDRDYYSNTGIPYYNVRRAIQIANPAVH